ncbi:aminotransferase class V-fold PLP-dependent enzyme [Streptomyces sp. NPDC094049]|uniref:pyridoxal-phosphate-dependent aminotransferase family protein n=1 Tax=Streptomyces sp. NPDC094049 TaxID=3154987 RepID=UPI003318ACF4
MTASTGPAARRPVLMNPGPVVTDERVRAALTGPDLCHREVEFAELMGRVRARVTRVCGGTEEFTSVVLTGSGTSAVEAVIASVPPAGSGVLAVDNGHYGRRMHDIARIHGIPVHHLELGWGVPVDLTAVESALSADPSLGFVTVVHHETSTGMLNDVTAVARVAHRYGRQVIVDAVSSIGAEPLDMAADGLDWVAGSANKNLEGMPGLGFVCARRDGFAALEDVPRRGYSLDLHRHHTAQEHAGAPAFTPGVPAFYAFDTALELMLAEGVAARGLRYRALAERLRRGLEDLGLRLLLPPEHRSLGLTAVRLPPGVGYPELHRALRSEGFVIYAAQEQLAREFFRLSTMGRMTERDIDDFLAALGRFLASAADRIHDTTATREGE